MTAPGVLPCPWCGKPLYARPYRFNPHAECRTEGCFGRKMPVVSLDVPSDVAAYNTRAPAEVTEEAAIERVRVAIRDGWGDGCSRSCTREKGVHERCSCWEMAKITARAALAAIPEGGL